MSRLGKLPVAIPEKVEVTLGESVVRAKGPKGELSTLITGEVNVSVDDGRLVVRPANDTKRSRAMWGTVRSNVKNLVTGVTEGFSKTLEVNGVGYRASVQNNVLSLTLGLSHEVRYVLPEGINCQVEKNTLVTISGIDKQKVGQVAAEIRNLRRPEPYKGKGVKYADETIVRKEGKKK